MAEEVNDNLGRQWPREVTGYHISPRRNRENILKNGLTPQATAFSSKPSGVYYSANAPLREWRGDVWKIKVSPENTSYDSEPEMDRYSKVAIPASNVQLIGHSVYDHTIDENDLHEGDQDTCKECQSKGISRQ